MAADGTPERSVPTVAALLPSEKTKAPASLASLPASVRQRQQQSSPSSWFILAAMSGSPRVTSPSLARCRNRESHENGLAIAARALCGLVTHNRASRGLVPPVAGINKGIGNHAARSKKGDHPLPRRA